MYIVVRGPKASAKATGPIVFKFSQKLNLRQNGCTTIYFETLQN